MPGRRVIHRLCSLGRVSVLVLYSPVQTYLKRLKVLIEYLIRDANLYSVKYKASGSNAKKPSEAWVFDEALLQMKEVKVGKYTLKMTN